MPQCLVLCEPRIRWLAFTGLPWVLQEYPNLCSHARIQGNQQSGFRSPPVVQPRRTTTTTYYYYYTEHKHLLLP